MEEFEEEMVEIDLREYMRILWQRKWILVGLVVTAIIASLVISSYLPRIYQTSTLVRVKEDSGVGNMFSEQLSLTGMGSSSSKVATYTQIMKSRSLLEEVIQELDLRQETSGELLETGALGSKISISPGTDSQLITITVNYSDPKQAKKIANTLVTKFKAKNRRMNSAELRGASQFITEQLQEVETKLTNVENKLRDYKEEAEVVLPTEQGKATLEKLNQLETAQAKAEVELEQSQVSLQEVEERLQKEEQEIISGRTITENPLVQKYKAKLADLEIELAGLQESYTSKHPQVIQVQTKIKEVKQKLESTVAEVVSSKTETMNPFYKELKQRLTSLHTRIIANQAQLETYQQQISEIESELDSLPAKELKLARLKREQKISESVYTMLRKKKEEINIQKAMKTSDVVVVDPAIAQDDPIKPKPKLNLAIATMLALFGGVGIIFVLEYLDTSVKSEEDITRLTDLPVLGTIPDLEQIDHTGGYGRREDNE
ncbi:GumC family protein [Halanaerobaculum tunisiense]